MISVLILTKDEAGNLPRCISALKPWCDDIVVYDSFSGDETIEVAGSLGARVFQRKFDSFGRQREAARSQVPWRNPWVLAVDADEVVDEDLAREMQSVVPSAGADVAAFRMRRKDYFLGTWIRRASLYPSWHVRLFRHASVVFPDRAVHEYPEVRGSIGILNGHLIHHNFSKGVADWWNRHVRYAAFEAEEMERGYCASIEFGDLLSRDPVARRRSLKALSYRLPCRPAMRYWYMMLIRAAVLDGPRGWEYCRMISDYQRITDQLLRERIRRRAGLPL